MSAQAISANHDRLRRVVMLVIILVVVALVALAFKVIPPLLGHVPVGGGPQSLDPKEWGS